METSSDCSQSGGFGCDLCITGGRDRCGGFHQDMTGEPLRLFETTNSTGGVYVDPWISSYKNEYNRFHEQNIGKERTPTTNVIQ